MKYCNLYVFVKKENPGLYDILEDMCAVGLFRPKYPTTFINPSKAVVAKLKKLVDEGEPDAAFEKLQAHFIYGKHSALDGKLVTYNRKELKSDPKKVTKASKFEQWKHDNIAVFEQSNDAFLEEGADADRPKVERKVRGSNENKKLEITKKIPHTVEAYAQHINGLLHTAKQEDSELYEKILHKLDPNLVLTWHILVKPTSEEESEYISDRLFAKWAETYEVNPNNKTVDLLKEAFNSDNFQTSHIEHAQKARKEVNDSGFSQTLESIVATYENKMLLIEDELRFRFSDASVEDTVEEMEHFTWDESSMVLFRKSNSLLNSCLHKIMLDFLASNAFHYSMYNNNIHEKLAQIVGAGEGAKKVVKILGNNGRKLIKSLDGSEDLIAKFVSSLSKKQVTELKKMLK